MAQNITLLGASYSDVPAVNLPKTGGGTAQFTDITTEEGKVVSNGSLVSQTSATYTANDTYDTTLIDEVTVNVSGGGGGLTVDGIVSGSEPVGAVTITASGAPTIKQYALNKCINITSLTIQGSPYINSHAFRDCSGIITFSAPELTRLYNSAYNTSQYIFYGCSGLAKIAFPSHGDYAVDSYNFNLCTNLEAADFNNVSRFGSSVFYGDSNLSVLVIRRTNTVPQLSNINVFGNTPFASGKTGGTLYVPSALISSYQSATNWNTILGYANNSIEAIEGSYYETHYADGTVIS